MSTTKTILKRLLVISITCLLITGCSKKDSVSPIPKNPNQSETTTQDTNAKKEAFLKESIQIQKEYAALPTSVAELIEENKLSELATLNKKLNELLILKPLQAGPKTNSKIFVLKNIQRLISSLPTRVLNSFSAVNLLSATDKEKNTRLFVQGESRFLNKVRSEIKTIDIFLNEGKNTLSESHLSSLRELGHTGQAELKRLGDLQNYFKNIALNKFLLQVGGGFQYEESPLSSKLQWKSKIVYMDRISTEKEEWTIYHLYSGLRKSETQVPYYRKFSKKDKKSLFRLLDLRNNVDKLNTHYYNFMSRKQKEFYPRFYILLRDTFVSLGRYYKKL